MVRSIRRDGLPAMIIALLAAATLFPIAPATLVAQTKAKAENVPTIPHTSVPNFFKLPPDLYFGEGIGIATNSKGHVFVYTRSGDTRLFEFDQNGTYVRELGQGLYGLEFAHDVRVDRAGQHLGRRRGDQHGHQVQPRGARDDGARPAAGAGRRRRSTARCRPPPPRSTGSAGRPT